MARPTRAHKEKAFRAQNFSNRIAAVCGAAGPAAAFIPGAGLALGATFGALSAVWSFRGTRLGKVVHDPPRDDFRQRTEPVESRLDLDLLRESPVGEPAIGLIATIDETSRLLDAMVTALERASGAELAGDSDAAETRLSEAYRFAEAASVEFGNSSAGAGQLREALIPYVEVQLPDDEPLRRLIRRIRRRLTSSTLASELPPDILNTLERMGFSDELRIPLRIRDDEFPIRRLVSELDDLAKADSVYGAYLADAAAVREAFEQEPTYEDAGA